MPSKPTRDPLAGREELHRFLVEIGQGARDELLLGLQALPEIRRAIIAECLATEGARDLGEFLEKLEQDPDARAEVLQTIRGFYEEAPRETVQD
ncbi:MAG TPA: hypothetical protein VNN79_22515 [Actinomycetota bacterium]|nr:hypothetical protein [Actinomycetota bacterium]